MVQNKTYLKTVYHQVTTYLKSGWNIMDSFSIIVFLVAFTLHTVYRTYDTLSSPFISDHEDIPDLCPLILRIAFIFMLMTDVGDEYIGNTFVSAGGSPAPSNP